VVFNLAQQVEVEYPQTAEQLFPYSVKIDQTAKGARISIRCNNNILDLAISESVAAYLKVRRELVKAGCPVSTRRGRQRIMTIHVLINRESGNWIFANQSGAEETEYITLDKNGDQIFKGIINKSVKTFLQQKEVEGFERF
jgi:hypothetical protein